MVLTIVLLWFGYRFREYISLKSLSLKNIIPREYIPQEYIPEEYIPEIFVFAFSFHMNFLKLMYAAVFVPVRNGTFL